MNITHVKVVIDTTVQDLARNLTAIMTRVYLLLVTVNTILDHREEKGIEDKMMKKEGIEIGANMTDLEEKALAGTHSATNGTKVEIKQKIMKGAIMAAIDRVISCLIHRRVTKTTNHRSSWMKLCRQRVLIQRRVLCMTHKDLKLEIWGL